MAIFYKRVVLSVVMISIVSSVLFLHSISSTNNVVYTATKPIIDLPCLSHRPLVGLNETKDNIEMQPSHSSDVILRGNLHWLVNIHDTGYDVEKVRQTQLRRLLRVRQYCETLPPHCNGQTKGHLKYLSFRNVTWCVMPKTGSTNVLRMICILIGPKCNDITGYIDEHDYVPKFMEEIKDERLQNHVVGSDVSWAGRQFLYVIVRDPWHRLVSTFSQKVMYTDQFINLCEYHNEPFKAYQKRKEELKEAWTFQEFLEHCILAQFDAVGVSGMEPHWKPQSVSGAFCGINYNYIAKTETLKEDIKVIIPQYKVSNVADLVQAAYSYRRPNEKSNATSNIYLQSWKSVDASVIKRLQYLYRNDLEMFGYSLNPI